MRTHPALGRLSVQQLYEHLHARILTGLLRPGTLLSETRVGEEFGLSRTPVRQAFHRLAAEGLLTVVPQVGTYVAPIAVGALRDAQFIRETLEVRTVALAAASGHADKERRLARCMEEQRRVIAAADPFGFFSADEDFHRTIMEIAGHPLVWQTIASAKLQLDRLRYLSLESSDWLGMIYGQHEEIFGAILAGDGASASAVMERHLRTAFQAIDRIAADHAAFFADEPAPSPPILTGRAHAAG